MIAGIRPDKIEKILTPPTTETVDDKSINNQWVKIFLISGGCTALAIGVFVYRLVTNTRIAMSSGFLIIMTFVMDFFILSKFIKAKLIIPHRFKKAIAKYGVTELTSQLSDSAAFGFFIDEDDYDNLSILTLDYFMESSEFVYALKDIKAITVSKHDISEENVRKLQSEHIKNVLRCAYSAEITLANGSKRKELFAMSTPDLNSFFGYLQQRAPHVRISYK